ncbi:phage tail protein [Delftia acidovorans]|uniref:phage tail protein n=1 Tax=Delftia acidovorans TaxID=80866 RepID=UPI00034E6F0E|nr:phage tail protein [Delftia acidovorans]EPD46308.1 hypothetical protein HMPREF9702_00331 [Delftia acidovorans CCUG 15835]
MNFLIALLVNVVIGEITAAMQKGSKGLEPGKIDIPTATEDRAQQYGVGVFEAVGNVIWSGDERAEEVTERVKTGFFSSKRVTVGHAYYAGFWMTLAGVNCDKVSEVWYDKERIWQGTHGLVNGVSELDITSSYYRPSAKVKDGLAGTFRFFNVRKGEGVVGNATPNPYIQGQVGESVPEYANTLHTVFLGPSAGPPKGFFGSAPQLRALRFIVERKPDVGAAVSAPGAVQRSISYPVAGSLQDANVQKALGDWLRAVGDVEGDANPALVLLELLTSRTAGLGPSFNPYLIDLDSFFKSAAVLKAEGIGCSFAWTSSDATEARITALCQLMCAVPRLDPVTGQIKLSLLRDTDAVKYAFNSDNVVRFGSLERVMPEAPESKNVIELGFRDRENSWTERVAHVKDPANIRLTGQIKHERIEMLGVTRAALAKQLASRELRSRVAGLARGSFEAAVPPGTVLLPGDLIKVNHEPLGLTMNMRITSSRFGALADAQRVSIEAVEDVFRPGFGGGTVSPLPPVVQPNKPEYTVAPGGLMLAPYALSGSDIDQPLYYTVPPDEGPSGRFRAAAQLATAWKVGDPTYYSENEVGPCVAGITTTAMSALDTVVLYMQLPAGHANYLRTIFQSTLPAHVIIGDEMMHGTLLALVGNTLSFTVKARGVYDTTPSPQPSGKKAIVLLDYAIYPEAMQTDSAGGTPNIVLRAEADTKLVAASEQGYTYVAGKSPARASRPLPPGLVQVSSYTPAFTEETSTVSLSGRNPTGVRVTWRYRSRKSRLPVHFGDPKSYVEGGERVMCQLGWKTDAGAWSEASVTASAVGAEVVDVSSSPVPTGARQARLRVWTEQNGVASREHVLYFKFLAS